jgi:hypothetical protein
VGAVVDVEVGEGSEVDGPTGSDTSTESTGACQLSADTDCSPSAARSRSSSARPQASILTRAAGRSSHSTVT